MLHDGEGGGGGRDGDGDCGKDCGDWICSLLRRAGWQTLNYHQWRQRQPGIQDWQSFNGFKLLGEGKQGWQAECTSQVGIPDIYDLKRHQAANQSSLYSFQNTLNPLESDLTYNRVNKYHLCSQFIKVSHSYN